MSKSKTKTVKIWWIYEGDTKHGYWSDNPEYFFGDLSSMENGGKFTIVCEEITSARFNKLVKESPEFDGW